MDENKLHDLVGNVLQELGGAFIVPLVQIGEKLGLYKTLRESGPISIEQLADKSGVHQRYLKEWLCAQAAANYVSFDSEDSSFFLSPEQAFVFANENSPFYLTPAFSAAAAFQRNEPLVREAFQTGEGISWGDQTECLSCAVAKFFRPGYENHLIQQWLPAIDGMAEKLSKGARVLDVGCGHGITTTLMANAFPNSEFIGLDFHEGSIMEARKHADSHQLENLRFDTGLAKEFEGTFDLVTMFDCLHDMGDPVGALQHIKQSMSQDGTCMIVEPMAGDEIQDNLNPVSRLYYCASTMVCVPTSLAQEEGAALGAQAGHRALKNVALKAGFAELAKIAETPFNLVLQAKI